MNILSGNILVRELQLFIIYASVSLMASDTDSFLNAFQKCYSG